ncbi:MAG: UrcA family protein [Rhizomicrobium sp.]|nr:UrcA family protein [Rhizomicrobium sp.]
MKRTLVAALLVAAALVPAAQAATTTVEVNGLTPTLSGEKVKKRVIVKFDDINPADKQGAQALLTRLNLVATNLCASNPGGKGSMLTDKVEKCRADAINQAAKDIDVPEFTAIAK